MIGWLLLGVAIAAEVTGTVALRFSNGFTRPLPTAGVVVGYGTAIWLLTLTVRHLPLNVTYAVWAGTGTALIAVIGVVALGERLSAVGVLGIVLIVAGVAAVNLGGSH